MNAPLPPCRRFPLLIASTLMAGAASVPAADLSDLTWTTDAGAVTITDCDPAAAGTLDIPPTIGGNPVRAIGDDAFRSCTDLAQLDAWLTEAMTVASPDELLD